MPSLLPASEESTEGLTSNSAIPFAPSPRGQDSLGSVVAPQQHRQFAQLDLRMQTSPVCSQLVALRPGALDDGSLLGAALAVPALLEQFCALTRRCPVLSNC